MPRIRSAAHQYRTVQKQHYIIARRQGVAIAGAITAIAAALYYRNNFVKRPQHTSKLRGEEWVIELLTEHPKRSEDNIGISQEGFRHVEKILKEKAAQCAEMGWRLIMFWSNWATIDRVIELGLGDQFDLPAVASAYHQKRKINEEIEAGDYNASKRRRAVLGS